MNDSGTTAGIYIDGKDETLEALRQYSERPESESPFVQARKRLRTVPFATIMGITSKEED